MFRFDPHGGGGHTTAEAFFKKKTTSPFLMDGSQRTRFPGVFLFFSEFPYHGWSTEVCGRRRRPPVYSWVDPGLFFRLLRRVRRIREGPPFLHTMTRIPACGHLFFFFLSLTCCHRSFFRTPPFFFHDAPRPTLSGRNLPTVLLERTAVVQFLFFFPLVLRETRPTFPLLFFFLPSIHKDAFHPSVHRDHGAFLSSSPLFPGRSYELPCSPLFSSAIADLIERLSPLALRLITKALFGVTLLPFFFSPELLRRATRRASFFRIPTTRPSSA